MDYFLIKQMHVTAVGVSLALFMLRAWWSVHDSQWLERRWVRILPHLVDTLLLAFGVWLMILLRAWPTQQPWLMAKLMGLVVYIMVGSYAIRRGRTSFIRGLAAVAAMAIFAYIIGVAIAHHPLSWGWLLARR